MSKLNVVYFAATCSHPVADIINLYNRLSSDLDSNRPDAWDLWPGPVAGICGRDLWPGPVAETCGRDPWPGPVARTRGWDLWPGPVAGTCGRPVLVVLLV